MFSILVIDDDIGQCTTLSDILSEKGYEVDSACTGDDALTQCSKRKFDLALVDINLGDITGPELVNKISYISPETEYIYITGFASLKSAIEAVKNEHVVSYEEKPIKIDKLLGIIFQVKKRRTAEKSLHQAHLELEKKVVARTKKLQGVLAENKKVQRTLEAILNSFPDKIITVDLQKQIIQTNKVNFPYIKATPGEKLHSSLDKLQQECCKVLDHTISTQKPVRELRMEFTTDTTQKIVYVVNTAPLYDEKNNVAGTTLTIRDITKLAVLEGKILGRKRFKNIIGKSEKIQQIYNLIDHLRDVDTTVLITGESGTGKELIIDALHETSSRLNAPIIKVNCAALSENLLESELFGHVKGAFTGASTDRVGRIQAAEGGTLVLDEVGEISPRIQLKLLRFLERKEFERVGDSKTMQADVRIITATNVDLAEKVYEGLFREDLYYRLKVMIIDVPPLRDRKEDIPLLASYYVNIFRAEFKKPIKGLRTDTIEFFMKYKWPGNVRELKHAIEHACLLCTGELLTLDHLPKDMLISASPKTSSKSTTKKTKEELWQILTSTDWNLAKTSRILNISRTTLYKRIESLNLVRPC